MPCGPITMTTKQPLTKKQKLTYNFIVSFNKTNSHTPTVKQICGRFKNGPVSTMERVKYLELKGWIRRVWETNYWRIEIK